MSTLSETRKLIGDCRQDLERELKEVDCANFKEVNAILSHYLVKLYNVLYVVADVAAADITNVDDEIDTIRTRLRNV